jgi:hypothetical protein
MAVLGNSLISFELVCSTSQHETEQKNEAETARNPLTAGISGGDG